MGQDAGRGCVMGATRHTRPARRRLGEVLSVWLASSDSVGVPRGDPPSEGGCDERCAARVASRSVVVAVLAVGLWLGAAGRVQADPLNPLDFTSLGAFPTAPGDYTINTGGTPTLTGPGGTFTGVVSNGVAVFDFNAINVVTGQVINGTGPFPAALLSRDGITVSGGINFSGGFSAPVVPSPVVPAASAPAVAVGDKKSSSPAAPPVMAQ